MSQPISVLLVDDSPLALAVIRRMLAIDPGIQVVGTAADGRAALKLIPALKPDVICTDMYMPGMDGLEFTREVMAHHPRPILLISSSVRPDKGRSAYPVLAAGALDIFPKPEAAPGPETEQMARELAAKIRVLAGVHVFRRPSGASAAASPAPAAPASIRAASSPGAAPAVSGPVRMIVIGASTGGPLALQAVLTALPESYPIPIACIQHISEGFLAGLVDWLDTACRVRVKIAQDGESPAPGTVYFPREGVHLEIDGQGRFRHTSAPPIEGHRPSVTATMLSAARQYGRSAAGVLLTGMGSDGAQGMAAIALQGGLTVAQDEASCVVFGMPKQAIERGAARHVLPPPEIAGLLLRLAGG